MDCSKGYHNKGCAGGWMDWAFDYVWDEGIMSDKDYPYVGQDGSCKYLKKAKNHFIYLVQSGENQK